MLTEKQIEAYKSPERSKKISDRTKGKIISQKQRDLISKNMKRMWRTKDMTERNKKVSQSRLGSKHPLWKGDNASYASIHEWVNKNIPKPKKCSCESLKKLEAHNISKKYTRNFEDWVWLCRSCHNKVEEKDINKNIRNKKCQTLKT